MHSPGFLERRKKQQERFFNKAGGNRSAKQTPRKNPDGSLLDQNMNLFATPSKSPLNNFQEIINRGLQMPLE